jgi:hypothetical protein
MGRLTIKQKQIRADARSCFILFFKAIKHEFKTNTAFAILRKRNPHNFPAVCNLLGLGQAETFQFLQLIGLVGGNNESYTSVFEEGWNNIAKECEFKFYYEHYRIHMDHKAKAYFILLGPVQEKENLCLNNQDQSTKTSLTIHPHQKNLQDEVRLIFDRHADKQIPNDTQKRVALQKPRSCHHLT